MPNFGDTPVNIDSSIIKSAKAIMQLGLENLVDSIKTKATPLPVALVGGAAALCQSPLRGTSKVLHHEYASVANAIGAARAKLSTTVDKIVPIENGRSSGEDEKILESIISEANRTCVKKGASRDSVKIIFQELVALPYIANKVRAYVQVVGELDRSTPKATDIGVQIPSTTTFAGSNVTATNSSPSTDWTFINTPSQSNHPTTIDLKEPSAIDAYKPKITNGTWHISPTDLSFLSTGTYILGCGGGGSPYLTTLEAHSCLQRGESLRITDISAVPSNSLLLPVVCLGSPIIGIERPGGNLSQDALTNMLAHLDKKSFSAIICVEVGGANGMMNLIVGSSHNVPIIDGDLMGRAFPSFEKITPYVFSSGDINELLPVSMSSGDGTDFIMTHAKDLKMVDRTLRALLVEMGCAAGMVQRPMSGKEMAETGVLRSHSLAWRLGRAVARCKASQSIGEVGSAVVNEFGGEGAAREIFGGKIVGSEERIVGGQSYGEVRIRGSQISKQHREGTEKEDEVLRVVFNNENLIAELQSSSNKPKILATVPSLIIILDALTGTALGVPEYRFGLKVLVLVAAPSPIWTSERGLEIAGPKAFGVIMFAIQTTNKILHQKSIHLNPPTQTLINPTHPIPSPPTSIHPLDQNPHSLRTLSTTPGGYQRARLEGCRFHAKTPRDLIRELT
ncbi:hypothetical protein M7I_6376 [Glarea lozoyensis 74030]|uniref:DUF917-domain-containing protein n=1 Tax=Glarea lozoyensis (strain ATCC 74030 / MF5533) TaxID=1104152 RepID=H0EUE2_GLAL7|nr:hypothetical protein M7I_6376 [Glarea lozoyensis 74030]